MGWMYVGKEWEKLHVDTWGMYVQRSAKPSCRCREVEGEQQKQLLLLGGRINGIGELEVDDPGREWHKSIPPWGRSRSDRINRSHRET